MKNKKAVLGGIMTSFITTVIIVIILLIFVLISYTIKVVSNDYEGVKIDSQIGSRSIWNINAIDNSIDKLGILRYSDYARSYQEYLNLVLGCRVIDPDTGAAAIFSSILDKWGNEIDSKKVAEIAKASDCYGSDSGYWIEFWKGNNVFYCHTSLGGCIVGNPNNQKVKDFFSNPDNHREYSYKEFYFMNVKIIVSGWKLNEEDSSSSDVPYVL